MESLACGHVSLKAMKRDEGAYQHKINYAFLILPRTKVLVIPSTKPGANAMVMIHHTSNAIKPKPIEPILLHPKPQITQQKPQHFMIHIIEQTGVPEVVVALWWSMEIEVVSSVEEI
jgi:hypothetical protein